MDNLAEEGRIFLRPRPTTRYRRLLALDGHQSSVKQAPSNVNKEELKKS